MSKFLDENGLKLLVSQLQNKDSYTYDNITENGWYRIAETDYGMVNYSALMQINATRYPIKEEEVVSTSIVAISGTCDADPKITHVISSHAGWAYPLKEVRIIYRPRFNEFHDNYKAYLEVNIGQLKANNPVTINIKSVINSGWNFYTSLIPGSTALYDDDGNLIASTKVSQSSSEDIDTRFTSIVKNIDTMEARLTSKRCKKSNILGTTTSSWYRIASISPNSFGIFDITVHGFSAGSGCYSKAICIVSNIYPNTEDSYPKVTIIHHDERYRETFSNIRFVYNKDSYEPSSYLEIKLIEGLDNTSVSVTVYADSEVTLLNDTPSEIPTGYTEITTPISKNLTSLLDSAASKDYVGEVANTLEEYMKSYIDDEIDTEINNRKSADNTLSNNIISLQTKLNTETSNRTSGDTALSNKINSFYIDKTISISDSTETAKGAWWRVAELSPESYGLLRIRSSLKHLGNMCHGYMLIALSNLYPNTQTESGVVPSPNITLLHNDYRYSNPVDGVRIVYKNNNSTYSSYLEVHTRSYTLTSSLSVITLKLSTVDYKGITFSNTLTAGIIPEGYTSREIDLTSTYNPSSSGGAANSANKLNTDAGSAIQPVYFSNGIPVATTYSLRKSVPSNAVFTDTHYSSKNVVGATTATSNTTSALSNGNVYINSVENGKVTSSHKISGSGNTTVTTDTNGNIIISSTDNNPKMYEHLISLTLGDDINIGDIRGQGSLKFKVITHRPASDITNLSSVHTLVHEAGDYVPCCLSYALSSDNGDNNYLGTSADGYAMNRSLNSDYGYFLTCSVTYIKDDKPAITTFNLDYMTTGVEVLNTIVL